MNEQTNTLSNVYKKAFNSLLAEELNVGLPAIIEEVLDYKKKKVSVKPLIKKQYLNNIELPLPIIENVPVIYPEGDNWIIKPPLKKGQKVWLSFSQRSMDVFLSTGIDSLPGNTDKFSLSDAVAHIGFRDFKGDHPLINNNEDLEIIYNDKKIMLQDNGDITLQNDNGIIAIRANGQIDINNGNLTVEA